MGSGDAVFVMGNMGGFFFSSQIGDFPSVGSPSPPSIPPSPSWHAKRHTMRPPPTAVGEASDAANRDGERGHKRTSCHWLQDLSYFLYYLIITSNNMYQAEVTVTSGGWALWVMGTCAVQGLRSDGVAFW